MRVAQLLIDCSHYSSCDINVAIGIHLLKIILPVQFSSCDVNDAHELNWTENWIELTWTSRPSYRTCSWSRTSASRLHFVLTGNRETRSVSARLVLNTCIPMRPFTLSSLTGVQCSSVHVMSVMWTKLRSGSTAPETNWTEFQFVCEQPRCNARRAPTEWAKKRGYKPMAIILSNLNRFSFFSLEDSLINLQ